MKKKFKDITEDEEWDICDSVEGICSKCPIGKVVKCCNKDHCKEEDLEAEVEYEQAA